MSFRTTSMRLQVRWVNDLRISRYVDCGVIKTGDVVQISYHGEINDNTIEGAISASEVTISDGDIWIEE